MDEIGKVSVFGIQAEGGKHDRLSVQRLGAAAQGCLFKLPRFKYCTILPCKVCCRTSVRNIRGMQESGNNHGSVPVSLPTIPYKELLPLAHRHKR